MTDPLPIAMDAAPGSALALCRTIRGQVIRRVNSNAAEYARRLAAAGAPDPDWIPPSPVGGMP